MKQLFLFRYPANDLDTPGILVYKNEIVCYTLEDVDRDLCNTMSAKEIQAKKRQDVTAIPYGLYELEWYDSPKRGERVPQLKNVKGFSYIQIDIANYAKQLRGCIAVGMLPGKNMVMRSKEAYQIVKGIIRDEGVRHINIQKIPT